jgi:hypothetical protein
MIGKLQVYTTVVLVVRSAIITLICPCGTLSKAIKKLMGGHDEKTKSQAQRAGGVPSLGTEYSRTNLHGPQDNTYDKWAEQLVRRKKPI